MSIRWPKACLFLVFAFSDWVAPLSSLAQADVAGSPQLHHSLTVMGYDDIPVKWDMKGTTQVFLNEGINSLKEGQYLRAIDQLTKALDEDKDVLPARYYRAIALKLLMIQKSPMSLGFTGTTTPEDHLGHALEDISYYIKKNSKSIEGQLEAGKIEILNRQTSKAIRYFEKAIDIDSDDPRGYYYLGIGHLGSGALSKAEKNFEKCNKVDSSFTSGLMQLAAIEIRKNKDVHAGLPFVERTLAVDSMQQEARAFRMMSSIERSEWKKALDDSNFLLHYDPTNLMIRISRSQALAKLDSFDLAFADIKRVLEATSVHENFFVGKQTAEDKRIDVQNVGYYLLKKMYGLDDKNRLIVKKAFCQLTLGEYDAATATIKKLDKAEDSAIAEYIYAIALEHNGMIAESEEHFSYALDLDDEIFDAHKKRAIIRTNKGKWKLAIMDFDAMERLNKGFILTYKLRGVAYYELNAFEKAVEDFDRFLAVDTTDLECYLNRAMSYRNLKNYPMSIRDFINAKEYKQIDFPKLHREIDSMLMNGDTVQLNEFALHVMKIPSKSGFGIDLELIKVKLMHFQRKWAFIDFRFSQLVLRKIDGDNKQYISCTMTAKGARFVDVGKFDEAIDMYNEALSYDKENFITYLERGQLQIKLNNPTKAGKDLSEAARLGDKRAEAMLMKLKPIE